MVPAPVETTPAPRAHWGRRIAIGIAGVIAFLLVVVAGVYLWLGTDNGRGFVARQVAGLSFDNGMTIGIDRIEGSIFGAMRIRGLAIRDTKGVFLTAPGVDLDWRPLSYARNHLDIRSLVIPEARLYRTPLFKAVPPSEGPLLPDLDIDVNRLEIGRLAIDPPVTGQRHLVSLSGQVHIADRRAQVRADGRALVGPGVAGGDRLALVLDAVPEANRLDIDLKVNAPAKGLVAGFSGIAQPMDVALTGKGDWAAWNGRLSGSVGADRLADVAIAARHGAFAVKGDTRPGLFLTGPGRNMLEPVTKIDLKGRAQDRRVQISGGVASDNFTFNAQGLVDLGQSSLRDLKLDFRLLKPSVIAQNLTGNAIAAVATLNGSFVAPNVTYAVNAQSIGFSGTVVQGLAVSGSAALDKDQWRIPVDGRAARITGIESVAPLLTNVRLNGDFAYAKGRLLSDNMKIRSDRIDATAVIVADMNTALYTGALNGQVNGYQVESVGIFNLSTNMDLKTGANGYFKLGGRVTARSTRLLNDGIKGFLGGNALIVADVGYDSNGVASIDRLNVAAPSFRMSGGRGSYRSDGAIRFTGRGSSDQYGPLGVDVTGTVARPVARIAAARPGMGIGLANVVATITGANNVYAVKGRGDSDYGPFNANVAVALGRALVVDVKPGTDFAGVGMVGRIVQTGAGPFSGTLNAHGSGIDGQVMLSAFSGKQRAVVKATARDASLPGTVGFRADRAIVDADVILYDQPQIVADVQAAGVRMGELTIAGARANVNYRGGNGQAKLLVEGRTRYPFRMAANALLQPKLWRLALNGRFNGIDLATKGPMRVIPEKGGYTLLPATITTASGKTGQGAIQLAGRYGRGMEVQSRLNAVNLALLNPFMPGLGLGGVATGSLDFAQAAPSAFPSADARMTITRFTRTSLASVSQPVDIHLVGRLLPDGGNARAIIRRRGAAIGRMQVDLKPLPPGSGPWMTRLMAAPLSGGLRYNGPADTLFSLAALPDQSLKGAVGVAADFSGRLAAPQLTGVVRANNLIYENAAYGTRLTDMKVQGRFTNDRLQVESLTARAGAGTVSAKGFVSLSAEQGFPLQLGLDMDRAQMASGQDLAAQVTGQIKVVNGPNQPATVSGRITLPETRYKIVRQGSAEVATLTGVRRKPVPGRERISGAPEPISSLPSNWALDLDVVAPNKIYVSGMGLESEWAADIHMGGTSGAPVITGGVDLVRGTLGFAGKSFTLSEGRIRFNGGDMFNPDIRIVASGDVEDVTIAITITGSAGDPQIVFSSTPSLPQDELMARILFGSSVGELSAIQAVQLASSLNSLRGGKGGLNPLGVLQSSTGIDRLRVLGADEKTGRGTSVAVGQYITKDVYVEIVTDTRGYTQTQLEIALSKALSLLSSSGSFGGQSVNLRYRKDY
ncbi:translocation/assembly module TamB domain-containing protein [Sphingobium sufflavum]|uniref:translocation/assembly module TamB domain-containing protein n=1 Tax=Sphingobium sufflavum TaxID=1129547 RepID=UPI001F36368A|nr:translocation/assembly module TamB domain-containing protein [Sphingobium sufflavum]